MASIVRTPCVRVTTRRPSVRTRAALIPEMYGLLHSYVCPAVKECSNIFVGTEEHQMSIVVKMNVIANHLDISGVEKYILKALLIDDDQLALDLASSADIYNESIKIVRYFISNLPSSTNIPEI